MKHSCIHTSQGAGFLASSMVPEGPSTHVSEQDGCTHQDVETSSTKHTQVQAHPTKPQARNRGPEGTSHVLPKLSCSLPQVFTSL